MINRDGCNENDGHNDHAAALPLPEEVLKKQTRALSDDLATIARWAEVLMTESCTEVRIQGLSVIQDCAERMRAVLDASGDYLAARTCR
ncbi:MAG TPA: hypothetical protein VMT34_17990 [Aggregatilineales bacterium]|nr:hypothetical protein [Aggregatilineales bacterium]